MMCDRILVVRHERGSERWSGYSDGNAAGVESIDEDGKERFALKVIVALE